MNTNIIKKIFSKDLIGDYFIAGIISSLFFSPIYATLYVALNSDSISSSFDIFSFILLILLFNTAKISYVHIVDYLNGKEKDISDFLLIIYTFIHLSIAIFISFCGASKFSMGQSNFLENFCQVGFFLGLFYLLYITFIYYNKNSK